MQSSLTSGQVRLIYSENITETRLIFVSTEYLRTVYGRVTVLSGKACEREQVTGLDGYRIYYIS